MPVPVLAESARSSEAAFREREAGFVHHGAFRLGRSGVGAGYAPAYGNENLWFGLDADVGVKTDHAGALLGLRLHSDVVDIRSGALLAYSLRRSFLPLRDSYRRQDVELSLNDEHAAYSGVSTQVRVEFSLFDWDWQSETEAVGIFGVPSDRAVYVEHLDVVDHGSYVLRQRLGAMWRWPSRPALRVGGALEMIALPSRSATVWRVGPSAELELSSSWLLGFELLPVVASPDSLGLTGGTFDLSLAYRFSGP